MRRWRDIVDPLWDMNTAGRVYAEKIMLYVQHSLCWSEGIYLCFRGRGRWALWWAGCKQSRRLWGLNRQGTHRVDHERHGPGASPGWSIHARVIVVRGWPILGRWLGEGWLSLGCRDCGYSLPRLVGAYGLWHWCVHQRRRVGEWSWKRTGTANPTEIGPIWDYCFGCWVAQLFHSNLVSSGRAVWGLEWWLWHRLWRLWWEVAGEGIWFTQS